VNSFTFRLAGGIGNQLFTYAAGQYFSELTGNSVVFDLSDRFIEKSIHQSDIRKLNLEGQFKNNFFNIFRAKKIKFQLEKNPQGSYFPDTYVSDCVGFDPKLDNNLIEKKIKGYFQSYIYTDYPQVKTKLKKSQVNKPGFYFSEVLKNIDPIESISVHIRRGDYLANSRTHGLLSSEYFRNSINLLFDINKPGNSTQRIFVFSDDIDLAYKLIVDTGIRASYFYVDNSRLSDEESLILMSKPKNIVISNSTYSWWGAWLGDQQKNVIAPEKWFKNLEDPSYLIPKSWYKCKSVWEK